MASSAVGAKLDGVFQGALREHRAAVEAYLSLIDGMDDAAWVRPHLPGKWSPAQITEHLALGYEAVVRELRGEGAMRLRAAPWLRAVLRWLYLPHALFHRSLPVRAVAPREMRPVSETIEKPAARARLDAAVRRFEEEAAAARLRGAPTRITHPYFGPVPLARAIRFLAVHVEHHQRQAERALTPGG